MVFGHVEFTTDGGRFRTTGEPRQLFDKEYGHRATTRSYDVSRDGKFLFRELSPHPDEPVTEMRIILNFPQLLDQLFFDK